MNRYNYRIVVQYDGTDYKGWQFQTQKFRTVQGELVRVITIIAKKRVIVTGSSRTDAGVHSEGLTANFNIHIKIEPDSMIRALNSLLPKDIRVIECEIMDQSFNARFCAKGKTYEYRIFAGQIISPFDSRFAHHIPYPLNKAAMRRALTHFIGTKDFSSFTSDEPQKKRTREIDSFTMKVKGDMITFTITGRSFLRYMVRNIIGTIIDVGRGKIKASDIPEIFEAKDRRKAGQTAPAKGLILKQVYY